MSSRRILSIPYGLILVKLATIALGAPPVILSLTPSGAMAWTGDYTNRIAEVQQSTNLQMGSWEPYYYDIVTNTLQATQLPGSSSPHAFYRLAVQTNVPDPSLVMRLSFENDFSLGRVLDVSGHGADAYNLNLTNPVVPANGKFGQGGYWGTWYPMGEYSLGPYLAVTNYSSFEFLTNGTVGVWAWPNSYSGQTRSEERREGE